MVIWHSDCCHEKDQTIDSLNESDFGGDTFRKWTWYILLLIPNLYIHYKHLFDVPNIWNLVIYQYWGWECFMISIDMSLTIWYCVPFHTYILDANWFWQVLSFYRVQWNFHSLSATIISLTIMRNLFLLTFESEVFKQWLPLL